MGIKNKEWEEIEPLYDTSNDDLGNSLFNDDSSSIADGSLTDKDYFDDEDDEEFPDLESLFEDVKTGKKTARSFFEKNAIIQNTIEQEFLIWAMEQELTKREFKPKDFNTFFEEFRTYAFKQLDVLSFIEKYTNEDENEKMDILVLRSLLEKNPELVEDEDYNTLDELLSSAVFQLKKMEIHLNLWSQNKPDNNANDAVTIVKSYLQPYSHLDLKEAKIIAGFIQKNPKKDLSDYTNFDTLLAEAKKTMKSSTRKRKSLK